jgi:hypothetical protein
MGLKRQGKVSIVVCWYDESYGDQKGTGKYNPPDFGEGRLGKVYRHTKIYR